MQLRTVKVCSRGIMGTLCLILATGIGILALRPSPSPICTASLDQIHPGMPCAGVEELLGGPPGDYGHRGTTYDATSVILPDGQPAAAEYSLEDTEEWHGDRMLIAVRFDRTGGAESAFGVDLAPPPWYRSLQQWLPFLR
jgi:hypothetical protein